MQSLKIIKLTFFKIFWKLFSKRFEKKWYLIENEKLLYISIELYSSS